MLRRLNVRTRLVAVIAVPLVLLLVVAVPEVLDRRSQAADASQAAAVTISLDEVGAAADAIQGERTLSAAMRAGAGPDVARALEEQRSVVDPAVERAVASLARLADEHSALFEPARAASRQLLRLPQVRTETDAAVSEAPWEDPFRHVLESLFVVQEAAASVTADLGVGEGLSSVALVARTKEAAASQAWQMAAATTWGEVRADQANKLTDLRADEAAYRAAYLTTSPALVRDARRDDLLTVAGTSAGRTVDDVIDGAEVGTLSDWLDQSDPRQQVLRQVETERATGARLAAEAVEASSTRESQNYLLLAGVSLLIALLLALAAARSITRPLRELTEAADTLAEERLPQLVEALRHPMDDDEHYLTAAMEPIPVGGRDELGQLAQSFNTVQSVAVDVAAEQATLLKKGISDLYVNLARRNQALLDRQIHLLDELEREEQDTEVLEHLYLLDHLATRMRRNAESLLVLAGAETGPRRSQPVAVVDVVRAAVSEVEAYERVDLGTVAAATLHGPAVSDVAHLVAELIENATQFSPPQSAVRVDGARSGGSYQLVISDDGVGMRPDQLEELNALLHNPPVTGLALSRSLGLLVAARLAARHGITVRLRASEGSGVAAYVVLPSSLLADEEPDEWRPVPARPAPAVETAALVSQGPRPEHLADALPTNDFDAGLQALLEEDEPVDQVESEPVHDAMPDSAPSSTPATSTLTRRVPGATTADVPERAEEPLVARDPDEVRRLLSRYRTGLEAGRRTGGPDDDRERS